MLIHAFLYDPTFVNSGTVFDPVFKTGGLGVLSQHGLSYFVNAQEVVDPRPVRANNLNVIMTGRPRLVIDQAHFPALLADMSTKWNAADQAALFAIIDQLCFAYDQNATRNQVELGLAPWPQYLANSYVYSTTRTTATAYLIGSQAPLTCPNYISFIFVSNLGDQYELRVWLSNALFMQDYPLSMVREVIPPLPLAELYSATINSTANVFQTALEAAGESQQRLEAAIQSGLYTGYVPYLVPFIDGNGNTVRVQFNILYNGAVPGAIAIRTAIRNLLISSGVGTTAGWQALAPSLFITALFYLLPLWDQTTSLINSVIYPNIAQVQKAIDNAVGVMYDIPAGYVTANLALMTAIYDNLTVMGIPDPVNGPTRISLLAEHPTYQDVATTSVNFTTMATLTKQFVVLLNDALAVASGAMSANQGLITYRPPNDNRTYVTFSVGSVEYYVMTKTTYLGLVP